MTNGLLDVRQAQELFKLSVFSSWYFLLSFLTDLNRTAFTMVARPSCPYSIRFKIRSRHSISARPFASTPFVWLLRRFETGEGRRVPCRNYWRMRLRKSRRPLCSPPLRGRRQSRLLVRILWMKLARGAIANYSSMQSSSLVGPLTADGCLWGMPFEWRSKSVSVESRSHSITLPS